jgi:hypothetical protein
MIKVKPVLLIALAVLVDMTSCLTPAQSQISQSLQVASDPPKPPSRGAPDGKEPAGTRGECGETDISFIFIPLLPKTNSGFSGLTLTGHPTFWFYIPYQTSSVSSGTFSLLIEGQQNNPVYQTDFKLPETPGFVSVSLPTEEKPLETNQRYRWKFRLYCASDDPSHRIEHTGTVQRVERPELETQLRKAPTLEERINLYVENGVWYDASTDLAQIRNHHQTWLNLLRAISSEQLNLEPIAGSVVPIERGN